MATQFDAKKTALLLLDLQVGFLGRLPKETSDAVVTNAVSAIGTARQHGAQLAFVRAVLDEAAVKAIPDHSPAFAPIKAKKEMAAMMHPDAPTTQLDSRITLRKGDLTFRKGRYGTFMRYPSNGLLEEFKEKGIDTIIIGGVVTSGAVLSAVRQLADLDYRLVVLEDCCADFDADLHKVLMEKVLPTQAKIIQSKELSTMF